MEKRTSFLVFVLILLVGGALGFFIGRSMGNNEVAKLQPLVNLAYPKPPEDIRSMTGTVQGIYGATIMLQLDDPNDYLPHVDGSPRQKLSVSANTSSQTKFVSIDYQKLDSRGNPTVADISLSDLKSQNVVTVRSNQNIRNASQFDVSEVQLVRF